MQTPICQMSNLYMIFICTTMKPPPFFQSYNSFAERNYLIFPIPNISPYFPCKYYTLIHIQILYPISPYFRILYYTQIRILYYSLFGHINSLSNIGINGFVPFLHYPFFLPNSLRLKRESALNLRTILFFIIKVWKIHKNAN